VAGFAARDEEPRERVRDDGGVGLRAVRVEVPQGFGDAATRVDGPGQLECGPLTPAP
jgi:hypothetical protein